MNTRKIAGFAVLAITILFALAPAYRGEAEIPIRQHHLLHAAVIALAAISGYLLCVRRPASSSRRAVWLVISVLSPLFAMLMMWPSEYSPLEKLPAAHVAEHLGLALFGFLTAYAGQLYASGVGVAMGMSLWVMALLAAWGFGISPPLQVASAPVASAPPVADANVAHGHAVFEQNCAACHGNAGQGGMGPALKNEGSRKNLQQAMQWIENPQPPMPKLYPGTLSEQDVRDVADYVESLR